MSYKVFMKLIGLDATILIKGISSGVYSVHSYLDGVLINKFEKRYNLESLKK